MRLPIPGGIAGKGGVGVVLAIVLYIAVQMLGGGGSGGGPGGGLGGMLNDSLGGSMNAKRISDADSGTDRYADCKTGEDANNNHDCARVAIENSLTDYWSQALGGKFRPITALVTFRDQVSTRCGNAGSDVGPFYCPVDESIYLDTTFFDQVLERQLGGPDGDFVEWYVLAHEYGHHISNLIGDMSRVKSQDTGPQSPGVRLELQADCFAGVWMSNVDGTHDAAGEPLLAEPISQSEVRQAQEAAAAVGDDEIQRKTQGQVTEESWTHGSAQQRVTWFTNGYNAGAMDACRTFDVPQV